MQEQFKLSRYQQTDSSSKRGPSCTRCSKHQNRFSFFSSTKNVHVFCIYMALSPSIIYLYLIKWPKSRYKHTIHGVFWVQTFQPKEHDGASVPVCHAMLCYGMLVNSRGLLMTVRRSGTELSVMSAMDFLVEQLLRRSPTRIEQTKATT